MLRSLFTVSRSAMLALGLTILLLSGCGQEGPRELSGAELQQLENRVRERWDLKMAHDWGALYAYSTPTFRRTFSKAMYVGKFSYMVNWELTGIEVRNYDADAAVASVAVRVMSEPVKHTSEASKAVGALPHLFDERWIFDDGEWWYSANI
jgi:hypothetical protein